MVVEEFEVLLARQSAARRGLEVVAQLDDLDAPGVRAHLRRIGINEGLALCGALGRYLAARRAVANAVFAVQQRAAGVAARLSAQPPTAPGSRAFEGLTREGREIEHLRDLLSQAEMRDHADPDPAPVVERARRAQGRLASAILASGAESACVSIRGAVDKHWVSALEVLRPFEIFEDLIRSVEVAIGATVAAPPVIVFRGKEAWKRITDRDVPRVEAAA